MASGAPEQSDVGLQMMMAALSPENAQKVDPNKANEGLTALSILLSANKTLIAKSISEDEWEQVAVNMEQAVNLLVKAGADPWAGIVSTWDIPARKMWSPLSLLLARQEASHVFHGPGGENDLHAFFKRSDHMSEVALICWKDAAKMVRSDWINEQDHTGATPLHVLWSRPADQECDDWARITITHHLMRLGAKVDVPDHNGQTVARLVADRPGLDEVRERLRLFPDVRRTLNKVQKIAEQASVSVPKRTMR